MNDSSQSKPNTSRPVFKCCPRCDYSLRGLPANHACPECGLRFDEQCELYRVANQKGLLMVWLAIFCSGWVVLKNVPHVLRFETASTWERVGAAAAVAWIVFVASAVRFLVRRYRRGFEVVITGDGLIIRLPGFDEKPISWAKISHASRPPVPQGTRQVAEVLLRDKQRKLRIGGVADVFPTRNDVERFVAQVNARAAAAKTAHASGLPAVNWLDPR